MAVVVAEAPTGAIGAEQEPPQRWNLLARLEKTAIGTRGAGSVTTVRRREPAGCLLFGPYWQFRAGLYRLSFRCRPGKPRLPQEPVLGVEVIAMNRVQLAWRDLATYELEKGAAFLDFTVPPQLGIGAGDEARLEFRFFHFGNADLAIEAVDLERAEAQENRPAAPRRWRMLGRLEKRLIGRRTADGIRVRRSARPGCLLDGGSPLLQLPAGYFRLDIRCEVETPITSTDPVLAAEIVAFRRWQEGGRRSRHRLRRAPNTGGYQLARRDFIAAELSNGPASLPFAVPSDLALEGGQDVTIGLRLFHLGNAALTIAAVELHEAGRTEAAAEPRRQWRLSDYPTLRGRPFRLQLPAGRYRLSFSCRGYPEPDLPGPVLTAEVVARKRAWPLPVAASRTPQALRQFGAEIIGTEPASLDFDVPPGLSSEGRERFDLELRVLSEHANLTVHDIAVREIGLENRLPAPSVALQRTRVLIVGNCQAQTIHEAMIRSGEFDDRLDLKYHFVVLQQNLHEFGKRDVENSDVLLVQDIRDWEYYPLKDHIRSDARIIKFPLLHFASLWPFDHYNGPGDKEAYEREWPNLTFLYHDGLLARLRKEIPDREQRLLAYRNLSVDGIINFARLHDFEKRRLAAMDQQFDCDIGRFILENFRRRKLFYTTNHPNGQIIGMLMKYLLRQLQMDRGYRPNSSLDHLRRLQVPVHPKVAQALGVSWASERTTYLYAGEEIIWETYVRRYIDHYG